MLLPRGRRRRTRSAGCPRERQPPRRLRSQGAGRAPCRRVGRARSRPELRRGEGRRRSSRRAPFRSTESRGRRGKPRTSRPQPGSCSRHAGPGVSRRPRSPPPRRPPRIRGRGSSRTRSRESARETERGRRRRWRQHRRGRSRPSPPAGGDPEPPRGGRLPFPAGRQLSCGLLDLDEVAVGVHAEETAATPRRLVGIGEEPSAPALQLPVRSACVRHLEHDHDIGP